MVLGEGPAVMNSFTAIVERKIEELCYVLRDNYFSKGKEIPKKTRSSDPSSLSDEILGYVNQDFIESLPVFCGLEKRMQIFFLNHFNRVSGRVSRRASRAHLKSFDEQESPSPPASTEGMESEPCGQPTPVPGHPQRIPPRLRRSSRHKSLISQSGPEQSHADDGQPREEQLALDQEHGENAVSEDKKSLTNPPRQARLFKFGREHVLRLYQAREGVLTERAEVLSRRDRHPSEANGRKGKK